MSIKIYDGLIATDNNVFTVSKRVREVLEPVFYQSFAAYYDVIKDSKLSVAAYLRNDPNNTINGFVNAEKLIDSAGITDDEMSMYTKESDLWKTMSALNDESTHTFSDADIFYHVSFMENATGGNPLVLVFGSENRKYCQLLLDAGIVEEYGYWDNTDPEEGITESQWEERAKAWGTLTDGNGKSPAEVALSIESPSRMSASLYVNYNQHKK